MRKRSIIDTINEYCATASPDAIALLLAIVKQWSTKSAPKAPRRKVKEAGHAIQ